MPHMPLSMYRNNSSHRGSCEHLPNYYILGLPRTKTVWLSTVLGCRHEYYSQYKRQFTVSSVDTNPLTVPTAPLIKLWRSKEDIVNSCLKCFDTPDNVADPRKFYRGFATIYMDAWSKIHCDTVFKFSDLHNPDIIKYIGKLTGVSVDTDRYMDTVIKTDNRSVTGALHLTAQAQGLTYNQLIDRITQHG
jgi:hypothetical protein